MTPNDEVSLEKMLQALDNNYVDAFDKQTNEFLANINKAIPNVVAAAAKTSGVQWSSPKVTADFMRARDVAGVKDKGYDLYGDVLVAVSDYVSYVMKTMYELKASKATGEQVQ